nr:hypothetical protein [Tanacetum cinerariifolium]
MNGSVPVYLNVYDLTSMSGLDSGVQGLSFSCLVPGCVGTLATIESLKKPCIAGFMKPINSTPPPTPPLHHRSPPPTSSSMIVTPSTSNPPSYTATIVSHKVKGLAGHE